MTQPWLNNPKMGDVSCASKGPGKSHCPWRSALGSTYSRQEEEEDQSLEKKLQPGRNEIVLYDTDVVLVNFEEYVVFQTCDPITFRNTFLHLFPTIRNHLPAASAG